MIGQRDVRWWDEIRNRRTRNIRNIWAKTAALGFIRKASVRRSGRRGREVNTVNPHIFSYHWTEHSFIKIYISIHCHTLDEGKIQMILVVFSTEHCKCLAFQQHGLLIYISKQFQGATLHAWKHKYIISLWQQIIKKYLCNLNLTHCFQKWYFNCTGFLSALLSELYLSILKYLGTFNNNYIYIYFNFFSLKIKLYVFITTNIS